MTDYNSPTPDQHHRFLASFLFGGTATPGIAECVWRAYLDLSRTVHGIVKADPKAALRLAAQEHVESLIRFLLYQGPRTVPDYDTWHRNACNDLSAFYAHREYKTFTIGQTQKWINMSVKYALTLGCVGWLRVPNLLELRAAAHAPLDNFFIEGLVESHPDLSVPKLKHPWSRIVDYSAYFEFQSWLRTNFTEPPLDVEFHIWQRKSGQRRVQNPGDFLSVDQGDLVTIRVGSAEFTASAMQRITDPVVLERTDIPSGSWWLNELGPDGRPVAATVDNFVRVEHRPDRRAFSEALEEETRTF